MPWPRSEEKPSFSKVHKPHREDEIQKRREKERDRPK
jgi:hypothetical protein